MGFRALTNVHHGLGGIVKAGEEVPATYLDILGQECKTDFDRLVELGAAEEVKRSRSKAKADEPEEPAGDTQPEGEQPEPEA